MKTWRRVVKAVGAIGLAVILFIWLVNPALEQINSEPLTTEQPKGLVGISLFAWTSIPSLGIEIETTGSTRDAANTMSLTLDSDTVVPGMPKVEAVLFDGSQVSTCDNVNVQLKDATFNDLSPQQKYMVTQYMRDQSAKTPDSQPANIPSNLEISERATKAKYQKLILSPVKYQYYSGDKGPLEGLQLTTKCAFSSSPWISRNPDSRFNSPNLSIATKSTEAAERKVTANVKVNAGQDLTLIRTTAAQDGQSSTPNVAAWSFAFGSVSQGDDSYYSSEQAVSAVFRSASLDRNNQSRLFLAGVSLGIAGSLAIAALSVFFDMLWTRLGVLFDWSRRQWRSFRTTSAQNTEASVVQGTSPKPTKSHVEGDDAPQAAGQTGEL